MYIYAMDIDLDQMMTKVPYWLVHDIYDSSYAYLSRSCDKGVMQTSSKHMLCYGYLSRTYDKGATVYYIG